MRAIPDGDHLGARPRRGHARQTMPLHHQTAGKYAIHCVVSSGSASGTSLPTGTDSPVSSDSSMVHGTNQNAVGGDAIALTHYEQVIPHHLAAGDAALLTIAYHERAWARQIAQRV
jgi:uncharacterized protein (DUF305 family)